MSRANRVALVGIAIATVAGCSVGPFGGGGSTPRLTILVNAPFGKLPWVGNFSLQGAQLAADKINKDGGVKVGDKTYNLTVKQLDNDLSPTRSLDNYKQAVSDRAIGIIDDGYTVSATFKTAADAGIPVLVDYSGDTTLIDADKMPNVFRIAPANDGLADHLASYLALQQAPTGAAAKVALVSDDTEYGKDGAAQLRKTLLKKGFNIAPDVVISASATGYADKALQVSGTGAGKVIVWARAPQLAQFVKDLRLTGSQARVYTGPTGEDPLVRTQLADHPEYVDGLVFASFRPTAEVGADPFYKFKGQYEDRYGEYVIKGVKSGTREVRQPPDWQLFPYDMVYLLKAALEKAGTVDPAGGKLVDALNQVQIKSANGDNRGFKKDNHEGVADDDIYFAVFDRMKYKPVQDDPTSRELPSLDQE